MSLGASGTRATVTFGEAAVLDRGFPLGGDAGSNYRVFDRDAGDIFIRDSVHIIGDGVTTVCLCEVLDQ